jgi:hypothetical protein
MIAMKIAYISFFIFITALGGFAQERKLNKSIPDFDSLIIIPKKIPEYYDLRNTGRLGEVKTQPNGGCWASAAIGSVESVKRTFGYGNEVLSDINLKLFNGFVSERSSNGNHYMATAYFTRRSGPLVKNPDTDSVHFLSPVIDHYIAQARYLPNDPDLIKRTIIEFGAVYSMMYFRKKDIDTITNLYYTRTKKINHAALLAGWNDKMKTETGTGAWIAQNSLGKDFGDNGFFYIPYQDPNILEFNAIWPDWIPYENGSQIYYYDTLGSFHSYGFRDTICYGLVKFTADNNLTITKVATHINYAGTKIYTEIYDQFDTATKVLSGLLVRTDNIECKFAGYYTIDLKIPVQVKKRDDFYVMMRYVTPFDTLPLPVETYIKGYSEPHITAQKCWINPDYQKWPTTWYECGTESKFAALKFDLCIRVYCLDQKK